MLSHFWTFVEIRLCGVTSRHLFLSLTLNQLPQMLWLWFIPRVLHVLKKKTCMEFWATTSWIKREMCVSSEAQVGQGCELQGWGCWRHTQPRACPGPQFNKHSGGTEMRCMAAKLIPFVHQTQPKRSLLPGTWMNCGVFLAAWAH